MRRVDRLCAAFREEILRLITCGGKRTREVHAVARVEGCQLARDSHIQPARKYPADDNGSDENGNSNDGA